MSLPTYEPMLATRWDRPFDDEGWWFEVKWDGYRAIVGRDGDEIRARSRRGLDLTASFPELSLLPIPPEVVLDGEIVAFDEAGRPSFSRLQKRAGIKRESGKGGGVSLVVFDLLYDHQPRLDLPYEVRRGLLADLALPTPILVPDATPESGTALFEAVREQGFEGIVGKRRESPYTPGRRTPDWRKVSVRHQLRAVVGGYLPGEGSRASTFGSLLMGLQTEAGLRSIGAVGSGFDEASLSAFKKALVELERPSSPFVDEVPVSHTPTWVEPAIVISVEYKEWTADQHLRAPVYKGIDISDPETVTWEEEGPD